jgi:hypothetical protein
MAELGSMHTPGLLFSSNPGARAGAVKPNVPDIYRAELIVQRDGADVLRIDTPLPENYMLSLATSWDNPFNQPLSNFATGAGGTPGKAADVASTGVTAATGFTTLNKWLSGAVWTGGSMMKLDIPFVIQAYENPKEEVVRKMLDLMKLVAPSEYAGQFLRAPGPYMRMPNSGGLAGDLITVNIGKFFTMSPCVIDNVTETFDTQVDHNGDPIGVTINVSVISYFTTTQEDLTRFFAPSLG